jgi:hypothetical protein
LKNNVKKQIINMKRFWIAVLLISAVCVSANAKKKETKEVLFGVKSGIITVSSDMGEMPDFSAFGLGGGGLAAFNDTAMLNMINSLDMNEISERIFFDDYGRKTATVNTYGENVTRTVAIGDSTYTINEKENTATVMPIFGGAGRSGRGFSGMGAGMSTQIGRLGQIDWMNLDKKTIRRNRIKELGEEQVAGVTCKKYSMTPSNSMGFTQNITVCIYEGIPLSTISESDWATTSQTAIAFEPDADIPESIFTLPKDCKVEEVNMGGFGDFGGGFGGDFGGGFGGDFDFGGFGGGGFGGFGGGF